MFALRMGRFPTAGAVLMGTSSLPHPRRVLTLAAAMAAGATLVEAAMLANHAAGIVVGKVGTATAATHELLASFEREE